MKHSVSTHCFLKANLKMADFLVFEQSQYSHIMTITKMMLYWVFFGRAFDISFPLFLYCEGHQKKLMLAVKRLAEMQRSSEGRTSLKKKPPPITQQQEVMSMDSPPTDGKITDGVVQQCSN